MKKVPEISSRGSYDLLTGDTKKNFMRPDYKLTPIHDWNRIIKSKEICIFIHGMRNTPSGAQKGACHLRRRLRKLGYKYPVVVFSYDSNVKGAGSRDKQTSDNALESAMRIATKNGYINLNKFLDNLHRYNNKIKLRFVAHSLGCQVLFSLGINTIQLGMNVKSIHFIGSPLSINNVLLLRSQIYHGTKIYNYVNPTDQVIKVSQDDGSLDKPSCLYPVPKYGKKNIINKKLISKDHRMRMYMKVLNKFP